MYTLYRHECTSYQLSEAAQGIEDGHLGWWLDGPAQEGGCPAQLQDLDLQDQLLQWSPQHLRQLVVCHPLQTMACEEVEGLARLYPGGVGVVHRGGWEWCTGEGGSGTQGRVGVVHRGGWEWYTGEGGSGAQGGHCMPGWLLLMYMYIQTV